VTKVGNGTLTFSGTKNYTGPTLVSGGKLAIGGGLGGSLTVNSGAALALTVAATPEGQPARVIAGDVTFNGGHTIELTAAEAPADGSYTLLTSNGTIGITGTPSIVLNGVTGSVSIQGNNLVLTVGSGGGSNFGTWATQNGVTGGAGGDS